MIPTVTEIAPDLYRISTYIPEGDLQFSQFLVKQRLAALKPRTIVPMHGSVYAGDGERAIRDLAVVMREVLG